jgi:hypothetical protein
MLIAERGRSRWDTLRLHGPGGFDWARAEAALAEPRFQKQVTPPDGQWWRDVQLHCAERDGDAATVAAIKAQRDAEMSQWKAGLGDRFRAFVPTIPAPARPSLAEIAGQLRELAAQNDPDVIRQGSRPLSTSSKASPGRRHQRSKCCRENHVRDAATLTPEYPPPVTGSSSRPPNDEQQQDQVRQQPQHL